MNTRPLRSVLLACLIPLTHACSGEGPVDPGPGPRPGTGAIRVWVTTTGNSIDPDGYSATLDSGTAKPVGSNGQIVFSSVPIGAHSITLAGLADNCTLAGTATREISLSSGATVTVAFQVSCSRVISNLIAFGRGGGGTSDIYLVHSNNSNLVRLTTDATQNSKPAVSPNGRRVAFISARSGSLGLYTMDSEGKTITRLVPDLLFADEPEWSPDGTRIVFTAARQTPDLIQGEIAVVNADGTGFTYLTDNPGFDDSPTWSPDGTRIAFFSGVDGVNGIYVMNADGSGRSLMPNAHPTDTEPAWSPDGSRLAFRSARDGWWEIYTMAVDGSDLRRLTSNSSTISDFSPSWSPDGSRLVFSSDRSGALALYIMNADGSGVTTLTMAGNPAEYPSWSR